ncbi:hypothetical protein [Azospirillum endophyticum]
MINPFLPPPPFVIGPVPGSKWERMAPLAEACTAIVRDEPKWTKDCLQDLWSSIDRLFPNDGQPENMLVRHLCELALIVSTAPERQDELQSQSSDEE